MDSGPTDADHDPGPVPGPRHGNGNELDLELQQLELQDVSSGAQSPEGEPATATATSSDQQPPAASHAGFAFQQRKEKGRVRFNSKSQMRSEPSTAASGSEYRRASEGAKPRPSLVRNPNSSNSVVSSEPDPDVSDPKKHKSALEAQQRAKALAEDAQRNPLSPGNHEDHEEEDERVFNWVRGSPPSTTYSEDGEYDNRNDLVPLTTLETNPRIVLPSGTTSDEEQTAEEQNERRNLEAQELLMAHGFGAQAQDLQAAIAPQTDGVASPRQPTKGPRGGVFYQILQAYRNPDLTFQPMQSVESGLTAYDAGGSRGTVRTPSSSGRQTPRRKWHEKPEARSTETLATLVGASTKLANPNAKEKKSGQDASTGSTKPSHRRKGSGTRILSMIGARAPEDEARITIHVADILQRQKYLIKMCRALMLFGAPTHRLEEYLSMAANVLEITCQFLYIPGCMIISFDDVLTHTAEVKIVRTQQGVNLGKLKDIHDIYKEVLHDCIGLDDAVAHLDEIISAKDRFPLWVVILTYGFASAVVACFFQARLIDLPPIFLMGTALGFMQLYLAPMSRTYSNVFEIVAAVLLSFIARGLGSIAGGGLFCFSALAQSSIALILPGWLVLCSALELQSKSMVAGSVRMVYAVIYSLFLGYGITVGTALYGAIDPNAASEATCREPLAKHWNFLFIPLYAFFSTIMVQAKWKQMPVMILIATAGYAVNFWSSQKFSASAPIAYTFGAFTIGVLANLYSRLRHGVAAAALLPAVYCQVPGSLASSGAVTSAICISQSLANEVGSEVCDTSNNLAKRTLGPLLDIQLDSIGRPYQPGDIITGRVVRAAPTVSPTATLGIQLLGRAKAKIVVTRYNGNNTTTSYYRSRYNFFDAADTQTRQQLHQGPIHVPSYNEPASWEFSVQIPTRASPRAVVSEAKNPDVSYLPLDATSVAASPLPSSFFNHGRHGNTRFDAYVEYHLEATLIQQGKNHHGADTVTATLPLHLRGPHMPYPLADSDLRRRSSPFAASSYRLVPGMEKAELTFKQKSKKFFGASSVPTFGFALQYESPGIIQLGGSTPAPIPFRVRVVPDRIRTSEALRGVPQVVTIASLEMVLKADTCVVAPGTFSTHDGGDTVKHHVQLPVAFAGDVPAAVLSSAAGCGGEEKAGSVGGGAAGGPPSGKEAAHRGAVHRPGVAGDKPGAVPPAEERVESSASSSNQPTAAGCSARESVEQPPSITAPELKVEPPADSSAPPTYQPRADDPPPPPPLPPTPPPAAAVTKDEQPPAYQLPRDLSTRGPLVIPSSWDADGPWLDVGAAVALRLHETHATVMGRSISTTVSDPVTPSFTTYCIRHTHRLKWKMTVAVGGETVTLEAEAPVSVLGATESG